jgi:hypothetical protein
MLFGFPDVGGIHVGPSIRYVLIRRQQTMAGEVGGTPTDRARRQATVLQGAVSRRRSRWTLTAGCSVTLPS